jgi:hypothetical protein
LTTAALVFASTLQSLRFMSYFPIFLSAKNRRRRNYEPMADELLGRQEAPDGAAGDGDGGEVSVRNPNDPQQSTSGGGGHDDEEQVRAQSHDLWLLCRLKASITLSINFQVYASKKSRCPLSSIALIA